MVKYVNKTKKNCFVNFVPGILIFLSLLMSIGYASISEINLNINGTVIAEAQDGIFITDVDTGQDSNENINYYGTLLHSVVTLPTENDSDGNPPSITYEVKVYNSTASPLIYRGTVIDLSEEHFYSNPNIEFKVEGINVGEKFEEKEITFTITFYFLNNTVVENNILDSYIRFEFNEIKFENLDKSGANSPLLTDGLIPVMFDATKNTWVVADENNFDEQYQWHGYDQNMWANAVLLNSEKRNDLEKNDDGYYTPGQVIGDSESDGVLAFYVWVPRYKYKVWNIDKRKDYTNYLYDAKTGGIDIVFENELSTSGGVACIYSYKAPSTLAGSPNEVCTDSKTDGYYTHPAFAFGDKKLTGFWMAKFELTGSTSKIKILPNETSLRNLSLSNFWKLVSDMQKNNNIYGLTTSKSEADTHMSTTMEWGAVAYLSHSKYGRCINGICTEVGLNSYNSYKTGCGPQAIGSTNSESICNAYTTNLGRYSSTTGNIYGIYDMSGGAFEHVMGNMSSKVGSYTFYVSNAGSNFSYVTANEKYLVTYANVNTDEYTTQQAYNIARLGDATSEVFHWYDDIPYMPSKGFSWFLRSGSYSSAKNAGIFYFARETGVAYDDTTIRAVLTVY